MSRFAELKAYASDPTWPFNVPQSHAGSATPHKSRNPGALRPDIGSFSCPLAGTTQDENERGQRSIFGRAIDSPLGATASIADLQSRQALRRILHPEQLISSGNNPR